MPPLADSPLLAQTKALACACSNIKGQMDTASIEMSRLRELLEMRLKESLPQLHIWGESVQRVYAKVAFGMPPLMGEALAYRLWRKGLTVGIQGTSGQKNGRVFTRKLGNLTLNVVLPALFLRR